MESQHEILYLREALVFLAVAGLVVPLLQRKVSPVLGYLLIGGLIGPYGLGLLADKIPLVSALVFSEPAEVRAFAEIGVIFFCLQSVLNFLSTACGPCDGWFSVSEPPKSFSPPG